MGCFVKMTAPHMRAHARLLLRQPGERAALIAASKVALMQLEVTAEHSTQQFALISLASASPFKNEKNIKSTYLQPLSKHSIFECKRAMLCGEAFEPIF